MLTKLEIHLQEQFPFLIGKKLLLAVSGGMDSMVLLELLHYLKYDISVAHCNFRLRGLESDGDEQFVVEYCTKQNIKLFTQKFDTLQFAKDEKLSIQQAARKLRYDFFYDLIAVQELDYIVTAHHLDDSLETFLINLSRGTGLDGLSGIPAVNDKIVRPLLPFSRADIEDFAQKIKLDFREDSSNASTKYVRNQIRHDVIPVLKEIQPSLLESFQKTLNYIQQAQSMVEDASKIVYAQVVQEKENLVIIDILKLLQHSNHQAYLHHWFKNYQFTAWNDVYDLVHAQSGKQVFSENYVLLKNRNQLILSPKNLNIEHKLEFLIDKKTSQVKIPLNISLCNVSDISNSDENSIFVDAETLKFPLLIRKWNEGDVFFPTGMNGKKKLSKYFKDEKFSLIDKSNQWLLCSDNQIVWIIGKRQDKRFIVTDKTKEIIKITNK